MKKLSTKKALLFSALAMVLCVSMLVGTTFAWFTDSASTNVNKIQAGNLDVALEMKDGDRWVSAEGKTLNFIKAEGHENEDILWEPGCTYKLPAVKIVNNGNLALKYNVNISMVSGDAELAEVLTVYMGEREIGTLKNVLNNVANTTNYISGKLAAQTKSEEIVISLKMDETAGNEYQGKSIEGIAITVYATQDTVENDSNNNQYDAGATLPEFRTQDELTAALNGTETELNIALVVGTYTLPATTNKTVVINGTKDTVIDMTNSGMVGYDVDYNPQNGELDITFDGVTVKFKDNVDYKGIAHSSKVTYRNCTLIGKQFMYAPDVEFINCTFINDSDYCVWTYGSDNAKFENCEFYTGGKAILIYTEDSTHTNNVVVNNCKFYDSQSSNASKAAIEIGDSQSTAGLKVNLTATNNEIYGFAVNNEGTSTGNKMWGNKNSIPADRLNVTASNNTEYDATVVLTNDATTVANALKATTNIINVTLTGDVSVNISLLNPQIGGSGEYRLGGTNTTEINIDLNGHKLTLDTTSMSALGANNFNAVINVKNGSIDSTNNSSTVWNIYDLIFANCTWNFEDVTFDKAVSIYTDATATMKNVKINDNNDVYALWITADAKTVTLDNVTINCPNGRAIAIKDQYRESNTNKVVLNISNSKFTSAKKAAVLVSSNGGATITASNVDISNVTEDQTNIVWKDNGTSTENGFVYANADVTINGAQATVEH